MKKPPAAAEAAVNRLSPRTHSGKPKVRLIWGADRLHFIAGVFTDTLPGGVLIRRVYDERWVPKYPKQDRWYLEVWEPPEFFGSPDEWHSQLLSHEGSRSFVELGPYPHEGDYRPLVIFENQETGEMVEPTEALIERIFSRLAIPTEGELRKAENERADAENQQIHKDVDDMFGDPFPFGGHTTNVAPTSLLTKLKEEEKRGKADEGYS